MPVDQAVHLTLFWVIDTQLPLLNRICSYFGDFSQSTACNATRFEEFSSTLLDKLWYTYSYIYKPASTTVPDIQCKFKSLHTSPFWLLAILKPPTLFISIPLCTTSSTLLLLAFLESTVPSFPPLLWTLFVIFFLSPVGTVMLLRLELSSGTVTLLQLELYCCTTNIFWLQRLTLLSYYTLLSSSTYTASVTDILQLQQLKLLSCGTCTTSDMSNIVQAIVATILINIINNPHIIDHGSLVCLCL